MRRSFYRRLWLILLPAILPVASTASQPLLHSLRNPDDSVRVRTVIERFFEAASGSPIHPDSIDLYAVDFFADHLKKSTMEPMWPEGTEYRVDRIVAADERDEAVLVSAVTRVDSLRLFGPLDVDWIFYLRRNDQRQWRIGVMRRMSGIEETIQQLRFLDTSSFYPAALKQNIVRERSTILFSNDQLRRHLAANHAGFIRLLGEFTKKDSLRMLGRIDRKVSQLNRHGIYWADAAEEIPQEAIDEFMKHATPDEQKEMKTRLKYAEVVRRQGDDSVARIAKKYRLGTKRLDTVIEQMRGLRVSFVNTDLPWRDAVQFTLAGEYGNALGYIYSPHGELPIINPNEYFYLEDLGGGWWLFRST